MTITAPTNSRKNSSRQHDDYNAILTKALADRLAEAFAEYLHQQARIAWGFGREEKLSHEELIRETISRHSAGRGISRVPRSHGKANALRSARGGEERRHHVDRIVCHASGRERERPLFFASRGEIFRRSAKSGAIRLTITQRAKAKRSPQSRNGSRLI